MNQRLNQGLRLVADGLCFPTGVTFGGDGTIYVAESGLPFAGAPAGGRILRIEKGGKRSVVANSLRAPVNGVTFHQGSLFVSEGGHPGRISRITPDGRRITVLDHLPGPGNYHTNMVAFGPDGKLYFSQGAMTNSGIVGLDAYEIGWLRRLPHAHDLPGFDLILTGVNIETVNPLDHGRRTRTGAFAPFGTSTQPGSHIRAQLPCTASIMRCNADGTELELVAWGLRNAYGLGFLPDGRLLAVDQGADDRGSRPVGNGPDLLFEIQVGAWYGWPDFIGGLPITEEQFLPERGRAPAFLLANHEDLPAPQPPLFRFPAHVAGVKFDVAPGDWPEWEGHIYIALFGDERPMTAPAGPRAGRALAYLNPQDWSLHTLVEDPLKRPIDVRFNRFDGSLYVLDFGQFEMEAERGVTAEAFSGSLWQWRR